MCQEGVRSGRVDAREHVLDLAHGWLCRVSGEPTILYCQVKNALEDVVRLPGSGGAQRLTSMTAEDRQPAFHSCMRHPIGPHVSPPRENAATQGRLMRLSGLWLNRQSAQPHLKPFAYGHLYLPEPRCESVN